MLTIAIHTLFGSDCAYDLEYYGFNVIQHSVNPNENDLDYILVKTSNPRSLMNLCSRLGYFVNRL